jgi:hypothetical protein
MMSYNLYKQGEAKKFVKGHFDNQAYQDNFTLFDNQAYQLYTSDEIS